MTGNRITMTQTPNRSSPTLSMTLNKQLTDVIRRYKDYCEHIQRLLKETDKSYNDITDTRVLRTGKNLS